MNTERNIDIVVAGLCCLDLTPKLGTLSSKDLFVPGSLAYVGELTMMPGGPVSNTGLALRKLGVDSALMAKIGKDRVGEMILSVFNEWQAGDAMIIDADVATSYTIVLAPPGSDRMFLHCPSSNHSFGASDVNLDVVKRARFFHFGYPPLMRKIYSHGARELIAIFAAVKDLGVTTSLDMSMPDLSSESTRFSWRDILENLLPYVDLYMPSAEETMLMLNPERFYELRSVKDVRDPLDPYTADDFHYLLDEVIHMGAGIAVIKAGYRGLLTKTSDVSRLRSMGKAAPIEPESWAGKEIWEEAFYVEQIATATGAGDSACAGFLAAFGRGLTLEECARIACCVGGQNVQVMDAVSGIHTWEQTVAMITGWQKRRQNPDSSDWRYDEELGVWRHG
ncbi:MAG TPA: PfkB family carbohydrate kinase [bacterium]|nr:PfkB family carbohydrate kinase [bacterium]HQL61380.1 PfkB family carbohydrate kinase [bacterium]